MTNARSRPFRRTAIAVIAVSLAVQVLLIAVLWWRPDPRVSCNRLPRWGEWITCLQGHYYILEMEVAAGIWLLAAIVMLLGRFLPWFISMLAPAGVSVGCIFVMTVYWRTQVVPSPPSGERTILYIFAFGMAAIYLVGPVAGAWLLGLGRRIGRLRLKKSRTAILQVFGD